MAITVSTLAVRTGTILDVSPLCNVFAMNHLTNYKHLRGFLHISRLMKKWVFLSFVLIVCMPIKAQVYIGGSLGISVARDVVASSTTRYVGNNYFFVAPEVGYSFNPYLALGASAGYRLNSIADMDNRSYVSASSYIRGTFLHFEHFEMFVDALFATPGHLTPHPITNSPGISGWLLDSRFRLPQDAG